jgi:TolA protein
MALGFYRHSPAIGGNLTLTLFFSVLLHAAVFAMLLFSPSFPSQKLTFGPVYNVSLVDFSAGKMADGSPAAVGKSVPSSLGKETKGAAEVETLVKKTSLKTRTLKVPAVPLAPIAKIDKSATSLSRSRALEKAIEEIKKRAAASDGGKRAVADASSQGRSTADGRVGAGTSAGGNTAAAGEGEGSATAAGGAGGEGDARINAYYSEIWRRIKSQWALPGGMMPKNALESIVSIEILRTGALTEAKFEKSSGNRYFDESVMKAIQKATPLPPLPEWINGSSLNIGIRFHSAELAR